MPIRIIKSNPWKAVNRLWRHELEERQKDVFLAINL